MSRSRWLIPFARPVVGSGGHSDPTAGERDRSHRPDLPRSAHPAVPS